MLLSLPPTLSLAPCVLSFAPWSLALTVALLPVAKGCAP
jgi:hypothetical protein